ncbi:VWA domain-containing protein [Streptomyces sp. AJS327]|uniref:vWA domain-containing protein n=1 Tax=Streptomyces sp. AJS327 TaxID=2545265 RepID=UPI0027E477FC|nr:VWA domain-containing protein [Streptomyces sp. AJS327]
MTTLTSSVLLALVAGPLPAAGAADARSAASDGQRPASARPVAAAALGEVAGGKDSMEMVLDASGSMAKGDGSGRTRIETARKAVGTVVDSLPDRFPTGLRVYGADKTEGCTDTRLVTPVRPLDRGGIKKAVAGVEPRGDTPIGLALRKAAADLPGTGRDALGRRTILLISDGEDNCGAPEPCAVAKELAKDGVDLRIDAIGFQVNSKARKQLRCVAEAGHGRYYDAPDADDLARELERAGRLSADGYRLRGSRVTGGTSESAPTPLTAPGQYLDTIGPDSSRWYSVELDGRSAADLAATGVPHPGAQVALLDGLTLTLRTARGRLCDREISRFRQSEGAAPLTTGVSRVPSEEGGASCDEAGTYVVELTRRTGRRSDRARWPVELRLETEAPLRKGTTPARAETDYDDRGLRLPTGTPKDVRGGTGFNDATALRAGVWRDTLLPAQTRWYRVPVGWGQRLRYDVEFANEPTSDGRNPRSTVWTSAYAPGRIPLDNGSRFQRVRPYRGQPTRVSMGTVPVAWNNRHERSTTSVEAVRRDGDYYLAVSLGADAARIAERAAVRIVLRVAVPGEAKSGPQHGAPPAATDGEAGSDGENGEAAGGGDSGPPVAALAGGGAAVLLAAGAGLWYALRRRSGTTAGTR